VVIAIEPLILKLIKFTKKCVSQTSLLNHSAKVPIKIETQTIKQGKLTLSKIMFLKTLKKFIKKESKFKLKQMIVFLHKLSKKINKIKHSIYQ